MSLSCLILIQIEKLSDMKNKYFALGLIIPMFLVGCSSTNSIEPNDSSIESVKSTESAEPSTLDSYNETMHSFNKSAYEYVLNPIGNGLEYITPDFVEDAIFSIMDNLSVPNSALNNALQGKFEESGQDLARFGINTTIGLLGIFDWATLMGIPNAEEDFGQTLGYYGVDSGPFVVLPFIGGATPRAMVGQFVGFDPLNMTNDDIKNAAEKVDLFTIPLDASGDEEYPTLEEQKKRFIAMSECRTHDGAEKVKESCAFVCEGMIGEIKAEYLAIEDAAEKQEMREMAPYFAPSFCELDFDLFDKETAN